MEKIELAKARDLGQTIGDPFLFARKNFGFFVRAYLYYAVPPLLVAVAFMAFGLKSVFSGSGLSSFGNPYSSYNYLSGLANVGIALVVGYGIFILASLFQQIYACQFVILKEASENVTNNDVIQSLKNDWKTILATILAIIPIGFAAIIAIALVLKLTYYLGGFLSGLMVFVLYLFFIYASVPMSNFFYVRLRERLGIMNSLAKCFQITSGNWWRTFIAGFVVFLVIYALISIFYIPFYIAVAIITLHSRYSATPSESTTLMLSIFGVGGTVITFAIFFIMNIFHVFTGVNYFSLSEKYDNFHLKAEINKIGEREDKGIHKQEGEF